MRLQNTEPLQQWEEEQDHKQHDAPRQHQPIGDFLQLMHPRRHVAHQLWRKRVEHRNRRQLSAQLVIVGHRSALLEQCADCPQVVAHLAGVLAHLDAEAVELTAQRPQFDRDVGDRSIVPLQHRYHHRAVVAHIGQLALNLAQQPLRHAHCFCHRSTSAGVDCRGNRRDLGADLGSLRAELLGEVTAKILNIGIEPIHTLFEPTFEPLEHECKEAEPYGPERYQCGELRNVGHRSIPSVWSVPIADAITPAMPNTTTMMPVNIAISDGLPSIFASSRMKSALTSWRKAMSSSCKLSKVMSAIAELVPLLGQE